MYNRQIKVKLLHEDDERWDRIVTVDVKLHGEWQNDNLYPRPGEKRGKDYFEITHWDWDSEGYNDTEKATIREAIEDHCPGWEVEITETGD